jgi:hypothetical protein
MAKRPKYVSPAEAAEHAEIVDVSEVLKPAKRPSPKDDPENYERREHDGVGYYSPTQKRAEELRALVQEHMKPLEPEFGWKGAVEAVVPEEIAADVAEAMCFVGAIVDEEMELGDGTVRIYSDGYWAHGF